MTNTSKALLDVAMSYFPEYLLQTRPDIVAQFSNAMEQYIMGSINFDQACAIVISLGGGTQPVEKMRAILNTGDEPLPDPLRDDKSGQRHKSRPWSPYEDQRLLAGIRKFGIENWTSISRFVGNGRTRSQCSQRWYRGLDPRISKDQWTKAEEDKLVHLIAQNGDKSWTQIAAKMGNRSDVQCRYKYKQLQRESQKTDHPLQPGSEMKKNKEELNEEYQPPAKRRIMVPEKSEADPAQWTSPNLRHIAYSDYLIQEQYNTITQKITQQRKEDSNEEDKVSPVLNKEAIVAPPPPSPQTQPISVSPLNPQPPQPPPPHSAQLPIPIPIQNVQFNYSSYQPYPPPLPPPPSQENPQMVPSQFALPHFINDQVPPFQPQGNSKAQNIFQISPLTPNYQSPNFQSPGWFLTTPIMPGQPLQIIPPFNTPTEPKNATSPNYNHKANIQSPITYSLIKSPQKLRQTIAPSAQVKKNVVPMEQHTVQAESKTHSIQAPAFDARLYSVY